MRKKETAGNQIEERNYGGSSIFYAVLLLIDVALIVYNLIFMQTFKEIGQVYYPVASNASFIEKFADRYFSFFAQFLGYYPSTKVLAVAIPLAFLFFVWFIDDYSKYLKQKARKKAALNLEMAALLSKQGMTADEQNDPAAAVQSEAAAAADEAAKTEHDENADKPPADSEKQDTESSN